MLSNLFRGQFHRRKNRSILLVISVLLGAILVSGCGIAPDTTGIAPVVQFEVVTTAAVSPTTDGGQDPAPTPTLFPATITPTDIPATATSIPPTAIPPTPTQKSTSYCDWVSFIADVTIPDGTIIQPGISFTKIWRIENRGTCTWTQDYALVFSSGNQMGQTSTVKLPNNVAPGGRVDVSVALTAPTSAGNYRGYWMLRNSAGETFGFGDNANKAFYVDIQSASHSYGNIAGAICYPSEQIPPMTLYLQNLSNNKLFRFDIARHQNSYQVQVDPGEYMAYAWTLGFDAAGGYTFSQTSDHRLKNFLVEPGNSVSGVDICDWYGGSGTIPMPKEENFGKITGSLSYPSESIPPLRIVATDIYTNANYWVDTVANQQSYEISGLAPGGYYAVVAYPQNGSLAGGYTKYAQCGISPSCAEDHTLVVVYLGPGETATEINPADWYGSFPTNPTP
ncbi:MAG: hypothetical protein H8D34_04785 [Chloroflexi bacterium]|nr:hypothetical protein [Chloroflexota bacterium]